MKNCLKFLLAAFFVFSSLACASVKKAPPAKAEAKPPVVEEKNLAPDFKLQDVYLNTYTLSAYKNKQPVLLLFWTTWCPFCQKELAVLNHTYASLAKDGVELFAINVGESIGRVQDFAKKHAPTYKILLDFDGSTSRSYELLGVPTYVLINKGGGIVYKDNYFPEKEYKELLTKQK